MAILETDIQDFEIEQATTESLFDASEIPVPEKPDPLKIAVEKAKGSIDSFVLSLIDRCELLGSKSELDQDTRMEIYDAKAAVRRCVGEIVDTLQNGLTRAPLKIGSSLYFVIEDPHAKLGNHNHLILLEEDANVSFMEPRGLTGDDDFKLASHEHNVRLIEDIIAASQAA